MRAADGSILWRFCAIVDAMRMRRQLRAVMKMRASELQSVQSAARA